MTFNRTRADARVLFLCLAGCEALGEGIAFSRGDNLNSSFMSVLGWLFSREKRKCYAL
jgi:hypothetical protein